MDTIGNRVCSVDASELVGWFDRAHEPWNPITAAERQLHALTGNTETAPALAAYEHLYDMADKAVRWLELNSCPDSEMGRRVTARMMAYRIAADTMRSTFVSAEGYATAALRELIDRQAAARAS